MTILAGNSEVEHVQMVLVGTVEAGTVVRFPGFKRYSFLKMNTKKTAVCSHFASKFTKARSL